jgi:hypothetical protein
MVIVDKPFYILCRIKGSDASWEDNNEPPPRCLDYSDDEEERRARRSLQFGERKVYIYYKNTEVHEIHLIL